MNLNWTRFNKYLYKYWKLQAAVILLGLALVPLRLVNPYLTKLVIDKAYGSRDLKLFLILAAIGGSIFIFNGILTALSSYISQRIKHNVNFDITSGLFSHIQSLPMSFFNEKSTGEHIYKINNDAASVSDFVCDIIPQMITLFPRLLFILVIVFTLNWKLAILAFCLVPISYLHPYFFAKKLKEITRHTIDRSQGIFKRLHEIFSHIYLIKSFGKEEYEIKRFGEGLKKRMNFLLKKAKLSNTSNFSSGILNKTIAGIIALYGGYQVITGTMTLGSLTAVMIYITQMMSLLNSIGSFYQTITINSVSRQRVTEIFDIKSHIQDKEDALNYNIREAEIDFKNVSFGYKEDNFVLKNLSFTTEPNSKIALVGSSGCGKSTLLALILRLYDPPQGSILIDTLDIKELKQKSLRGQIGITLQEPFLWNDTVKNNILYGNEKAGKDEIIKAAEIAQAHDFIIKLPQGYETIIGERACKISEGQKQRIAIARAVIKRPKILILDEAMSSVDSETENKIIDNIRREFKDSTVIIVSHRLSAAKKMDLVYFLEGPGSLDIGTHQELTARNSKYVELFANQMEKIEIIQ